MKTINVILSTILFTLILGNVLHCVIAYDQGNWSETQQLHLTAEDLQKTYITAIEWASELSKNVIG